MLTRFGKGFLCLLTALFGLLLLTALVEGPPTEAEGRRCASPFMNPSALLPYTVPIQEEGGADEPAVQTIRTAALAFYRLALAVPMLRGCKDANGRVIRNKRYVDSAYQMFRPEVAGG